MITKVRYPLLIAGIFAVALFFRTYFPYPNVFANGWVNYQETDCYYNMRVITNLAQHFPHMMPFDPYAFSPSGILVSNPPVFYYLFAFIAWVIGLGHPTLHTIEMVGAYLPAIIGALVTIPVFFLGKELFGKQAGLLATAIIAILPGQFLWRGELGFPDYHILEALLSATAMLFLVMALRRTGKVQWVFSALAGIFLTLYLLTWAGGGMFVFIIFVFILIQSIINRFRDKSNAELSAIGTMTFGLALVIVWLSGYRLLNSQIYPLVIATVASIAIYLFSRTSAKTPKMLYPAILVISGLCGLGLLSIFDPTALHMVSSQFSIFKQSGSMLTIAEAQGMTFGSTWSLFALCFYTALASLVVLAYLAVKENDAGKSLLVTWGLILLATSFRQNRFAYYLAIPVALLSAYLCWKIIEYVRHLAPIRREQRAEFRRKSKRKKDKKKQRKQGWNPQTTYTIAAALVIALAIFIPLVPMSIDRVSANTGLSTDWHNALVWLGNNTPEPLPDYPYYKLQPSKDAYVQSGYGVMSWWDYGYWISYISHRIPNANPSQMGAKDAGLFFTSGNESEGNAVLDRLGSKYIIIDDAMNTGKFYAMAVWAGENASDYMSTYYYPDKDGLLQPTMLLLPAYYKTMCSRLYNFDGKAVVPSQVLAVLAQPQQVQGNTIMVIKDVKQYSTYGEAQAFISSNPNYFIAGQSFSQSIVPLEPLASYSLVYSNSSIKIFSYKGETP